MDRLIEELLGVLQGQAALYQSLLLVLRDENTAIVESSLENLNDANNEKKTLILKIQNLEKQRLDILERLADSLGYPDQPLTLETLSRFSKEPFSNRIRSCRSNLFSLMKSIREANDSNRSLLTHSIDLVRGSMSLLNNLIASNSVYYRTGKVLNTDKNGRVFSGEI